MESPIVLSIIGLLLFASGAVAGLAWADAKREAHPINELDMLRWERNELLSLLDRYSRRLTSPIGAVVTGTDGRAGETTPERAMDAATSHAIQP